MLFAALIVPWFVNWDDYKASFEREAGRILGHPVHVIGSAKATILPSPSLTFTNVTVGGAGEPMMTVDRFEVTIELLPIIQGEIRVTSMRLDRPVVRIVADEKGKLDWMERAPGSGALELDKVSLAGVQVANGTLLYSDPHTGVAHRFDQIEATVEAVSLAGPWRIGGSYIEGGAAVPFHFATGRRTDDGGIRLKGDVNPAQWPVSVSADGVLSLDENRAVAYAGTYSVAELVPAEEGKEGGQSAGWRSEGTFALGRDRLAIDQAVLSNGPVDRPTSVAGSLTLNFGHAPSFSATAESRQLDLDRSFGGGPDRPVEVAAVSATLIDWLGRLTVPAIPGKLAFRVPGIVVGGSVIQDVTLAVRPAAGGWQVDELHARLPGQADLSVSGMLATGRQVAFSGAVRLAAVQPATFAAWWRGRAQPGIGRQLAAFDIGGDAVIAAGRFSLDDIRARVGDAALSGRLAWSENARDHHRDVGIDLQADRIDFVQVKALADLLIGRSVGEVTSLADNFSILLKTDLFQFDDVRLKDVSVDVGYAGDRLTVTHINVGDIGGASFRATSGRIDGLTTKPEGLLEATLEAQNLDGLALIAGKIAPQSGILQWLGRASPALTPAVVKARITAPAGPDGDGIRITIENGVAGSTTFDMELRSSFRADWRSQPAELTISSHSPDSADLARLVGLAAVAEQDPQGADIDLHAVGIPDDGLAATIAANIAGLDVSGSGKLTLADDGVPGFTGPLRFRSDAVEPFLATAGLAIPGNPGGTAVDASGTLAVSGSTGEISWQDGTFGDRHVGGAVKFSRVAEQGWRLDGDLAVDRADLGWLMALGLGASPLPDFEAGEPWPKTLFSEPGYGPVSGKLGVTANRLGLGGTLEVAGAKMAIALQPQRIDVDLVEGHLRGAAASGGVSIHNVGGNINLAGRFNLQGAPLESMVWERDGRAVATGVLDLSANFEATGRSPAGLVSSTTGGGVLAVRDGEARYVNPNAAKLVIRASDIGQEFSDAALRMTVAERIDADSLAFGETGGAFSIAAGAVRLKGLSVRAGGVEGAGSAVLDLNTLQLNSDWTLKFDAGDTKVEGTSPQIGLVFRGPVAAPERIIDILPFSAYLNTRREARILEILATEEADRLERERLSRLMRKQREDAERTAREEREAAEAEARRVAIAEAAAASIARLHVEREIAADEHAASVMGRVVEQTARARDAAQAEAAAATQAAADAHAEADAAAVALAAAVAEEGKAAAALAQAEQTMATAQATASASREHAEATEAEATRAETAAAAASDGEATAREEAGSTAATKERAEAALTAANASAEETARDAESAATASAGAKREADTAAAGREQAVAARDEAETRLEAATAELAEAEAGLATIARRGLDALQANAESASREQENAEKRAGAAATAAKKAQNARDAAAADLREAEADFTTAEAALATAQRVLAQQKSLSNAAGAPDPDAVTLEDGLARQALAHKARVDQAHQTLQAARSAYADAEANATRAASEAGMMQEALESVTATARRASAVADDASADDAAARKLVADKTTAHDVAQREAETRRDAARQAIADAQDADDALREATDRAVAARAAAEAAVEMQRAAAADVAAATSAASDAAFTLENATAERVAADEVAGKARVAAKAARDEAGHDAGVLADATAARDAAAQAAKEAAGVREGAERRVAEAAAAVERADAAAVVAGKIAEEKAADAQAAAVRAGISQAPADAPVPTPRPRRQSAPVKIIPDALAGDAPMLLVPPN